MQSEAQPCFWAVLFSDHFQVGRTEKQLHHSFAWVKFRIRQHLT